MVHVLCVIAGVYRSLQQSYSISSQDVLMAMDYCEESLQEIDVTSFLNALCGHMRAFREGGDVRQRPDHYSTPVKSSSTFVIGDGGEEEEEERPEERAAVTSSSRYRSLLACSRCAVWVVVPQAHPTVK